MDSPFDRKAALRAYKERKVRSGIYGIRLKATGRTWPGSANDLDATRNGQWGVLNEGRHLAKDLQAEWTRLGQDAFEYVVLEVLEPCASPLVLKETLKERKAAWAQRLGGAGEGGR
ncbi:GIY-YIG nuclease family protein [Mesoterricola silvestris]|uniref:GIY-YIG nuclease family protein n=1 Tax=Mesoterricola silvestris TaxID=2927979 RepID=A0AA48H8X6_9BACT|nr:GIY-YIG nuclease family protein [Mesoterricola silvestris]BDU73953.1 hypothetical protein METEAL_31270 [Mesoterricola silvestris]